MKYFKILKKRPFVSVTSLQRIMSVTIEFILKEVNIEYCPLKEPRRGKKTDTKNYCKPEELACFLHIVQVGLLKRSGL